MRSLYALLGLSLLAGTMACGSSGGSNTPITTEDTGTQQPAETAPVAPAYPEGPYGLLDGNIFPNLSFEGYKNGTGEWTTVRTSDYYDPDGTKGVYALLIIVSAQWCAPCNAEAAELPDIFTKQYAPRGAKFMTAMLENRSYGPATKETVDQWLSKFKLPFDTVMDPKKTTLPKSSANSGIPRNYIINPRDMRILKANSFVVTGPDGIKGMDQLLDVNGAPLPK